MTDWYVPHVVKQLDGSKCASSNCWAASGACQLDAATGGAAVITPTVFRQRAGGGSGKPSSPGKCRSGFEVDVLDGLHAMGVKKATMYDVSVQRFRTLVTKDRSACFTIATDYELWPEGQKCAAPDFDGNHMVLVLPGDDAKGRITVANPLCPDFQRIDLGALTDAAVKFSKEHGRGGLIRVVRVFRPAVHKAGEDPALEKALERIDELEGIIEQASAQASALVDTLAEAGSHP